MRSFDAAELGTVERFLREVAAAARWPDGQRLAPR
jgi:hypothetical protein